MIIEDYSDHIDMFESYLKDKLNNICEIDSDDKLLFQKVLYVSFLDSLAACVYPKRSNGERFVSVVEEFGKWRYANYYCLLHIAKFTSLVSDPVYSSLRKFSHDEVKSWPDKTNGLGVIRMEKLPEPAVVKSKWKNAKVSDDGVASIDEFKYSKLLFKLRNSLVHQFQSKGTEIGGGKPNEPYYQIVNTQDSSGALVPNSIELVFPTPMLHELCKTTLKNVCKYLREGNMNPFPHYHSGDYWIEGLN